MKKIFRQQLLEFLLYVTKAHRFKLDDTCKKELEDLIEKSVDRVYRFSFQDCIKEEMRQFAKTNLSLLLNRMHIDARRRNKQVIDNNSLHNALLRFNCLWPYKSLEKHSVKRFSIPVATPKIISLSA